MSLIEQQNFLARLYIDSDLRRKFLSEPVKIGTKHNLTEREIAEFAAVLPEELNFFADSLFWKRLHEVEKNLPLTKEFSGEDFAKKFRVFSQTFTPQTIKKHLEDAIEFSKFLQTEKISDIAKDAAKFELTKLEFFARQKIFSYCFLKNDLETAARKKTFVYWMKIGKQIFHGKI